VTKRKREEEPDDTPIPEAKRITMGEIVGATVVQDSEMRDAPIWAEQSDSGEDF
jgi:hypothetical protein